MKLYEIDIAGVTHTVQLDEDQAKAMDAKAVGEAPEATTLDLRAPSAKGETEDEMGRPLVESVQAENEAVRSKRREAANKARATENK